MKTELVLISVGARVQYAPEQSDPSNQKFVWSYEMTIGNESNQIVQLLNRYWRITNMSGHIEEVRGPGVVGLQPVIKPGKRFVYTSYCQLTTPHGTMEGNYEIQDIQDEKHYLVDIPKFVLSAPAEIAKGYRSKLH